MDTAIIGDYASDKLLITSIDIHKSNNKNIQQAFNRKIVTDTRQDITITLEGYLSCNSFDDLEEQLDLLHEALYQKEVKVVVGNRPDTYFVCSWDSADLPRKPQNGGYVLPLSLSFTCLEESGVKAIPSTLGIKYIPEVNYFVNQQGNKFNGPVYVPNPKTTFINFTPNTGFEDFVIGNNTFGVTIAYKPGYATNKVFVSLYISGTQVFFKTIPDFGTFTVGLVTTTSGISVYINGVHYDYFGVVPDFTLSVYPNPNLVTHWFIAANYSAPKAYVNKILNLATAENIISTAVVSGSSTTINYKGTMRTDASLISNGVGGSGTYQMNDFGVGFVTPLAGDFTFNSIERDVIVQWSSEIPNVIYTNKTLFPYLNKGINVLTKIGSTTGVLAWFNRWI